MLKQNNYICTKQTLHYKENIEKILLEKRQTILDFFEVEDMNQFYFHIYIYDTLSDLITGLKKRGFNNIPSYICACYKDEDNSLNFYEPKEEQTKDSWNKEEYNSIIFHEYIHAIQNRIYGKQPEWLTEGIALYLDGQYTKGIQHLMENYIQHYKLPTIDLLKDNTFVTNEYDGYDLSYLMISYLIETIGKKEFLQLIKQQSQIKTLSKNLLNESVHYYKKINQLE